ncbi:MAG: C39 family peptidase [Candidatus Brachytrichaceae bacterium NZ_4S206]
MPKNPALIEAANRAAGLLGLPTLLLKAFMAVEGANPDARDGVLQVTPATRASVISRMPRALKLTALDLSDDPAMGDADLNARFAQAFEQKHLLVQTLTGGWYVKEQLDRFNGYVALAGLAYNAGPGRARREVEEKWGGDLLRAALQYHKRIGARSDEVTVQPGIPTVDTATGVQWIRFPVTANDTGLEIFQYLYLRQVPKRNFGLLDFIFRPTLLDRLGLFDDDAPPGEDRPDRALIVVNGRFEFAPTITQPVTMFNTLPLSQRDPRWKDILLGFTDEGRTIGSDGCTLTCLTMLANGFGFQETPATLNDKLKALGPNQGFFGALIAWFGVPRVLPGLKLNKLVECRRVPAPMAEIDAALDAGKPVVVELDMSPSPGFQNHWVLIYARQGNDYLIHDPWPWPPEQSASLTQRYGFAGSPAQIITYCAFYDNPNFRPPDGPPQPEEKTTVIVVNDVPDIHAVGGLALRDRPSAIGTQILQRLPAGTTLTLLEPVESARQKVGVYNQWLNVAAPDGTRGWVAAWYVHAREITVTKSLPEPAKRGKPRELDVDTAVQPPLRAKVFVRAKKTRKRVAIYDANKRTVMTYVKGGTKLEAIGDAATLARTLRAQKTAKPRWIKVLAGKRVGYVRAHDLEPELIYAPKPRKPPVGKSLDESLIVLTEPDARPALRVIAPAGLRLRDAPSMNGNTKMVLPYGTLVLLREPLDVALPKIGRPGQWLAVSTFDGVTGFVSAEWVVLATTLPPSPDVRAQGVVLASMTAPLHERPSANSRSEWRVTAGTPLRLLSDGDWDRVGDEGAFVQVETFAFKRGYVRGSHVRAPDFADRRVKVEDAPLPFGICAWNYGLHDPFDRSLFAGSGKTGWVLITHRVVNGEGYNYEDWSRSGYGVIARLNNDYGGSGTIPTPDQYDAFADQCRRWVLNSRGNLIWVIGNEMNNPREWPNQDPWNPGNNPADAITPGRYAACFNKVRAAIKSVQPRAIVVPGAIDPFQGPRQSCLEYFEQMLAAITDLDGIALHCYTHGYTPDLVASLDRFEHDPLRWQYYHFRAYTTLLDIIPPRHRFKPVYITETNPHGAQPWSGGENGWVQAAYAEIARYNDQPHAQQIQCLLLYRWSRDDIYSIVDKPGVQNDIRATIRTTDYRWRG